MPASRPPFANIRRLIILKNGSLWNVADHRQKAWAQVCRRNFRGYIPAFYLFQTSRLFRKRSGDLISTGYSTTLTDPACAYADEIRRVYIHGLGKSRVWLPTRFKLQIEVQGNLPRDAIAMLKISISHISRVNNFPFWLTNLVTWWCLYYMIL